MRIVYCTDTICYPGGIQTVTMVKANALAKIPGNEVWIVVTDHKKPPMISLKNVNLINLDVNYYEDDWRGFWYVLKGVFQKRHWHKERLQKVLNDICPDVVISTGTSEKYFLPSIKVKSSPSFIREMHFVKNYRVLEAVSLKEKFFTYLSESYDYKYRIKKYDKIVVLTTEDLEDNWNGYDNVVVIPNPMTAKVSLQSECRSFTAITAGRLVQTKNFRSLISIWKGVVETHPKWTLEIWGVGGQEKMLRQYILDCGLEGKVLMKGFTSDIYAEMAKASMFLLTSEHEGFPLVLIEAMSVGLPVVSYACPAGPKDIVKDAKNGFLIPLNDEEMFADRICTLMENEDLRMWMGNNALLTSEKYQMEKIIDTWMKLFYSLREIEG